jgi:Fic/DOC family
MNDSLHPLLVTVDALYASLESLSPVSDVAFAKQRDHLALEFVTHSCGLAGGALKLFEMKVILKGTAVPHASLLNHLGALDMYSALRYVEFAAVGKKRLSEHDVSQLNYLVQRRVHEKAGEYSCNNIWSTVEDLLDWCDGAQKMHPIIRAAQLHNRFLKIHPFIHGNESTARLLICFELLCAGYPLTTIRKELKAAYEQAINAARFGDDTKMLTLVARAAQQSLERSIGLLMLNETDKRRR